MAGKVMEIVLVAMVMVILIPLKAKGETNCQNEIASLSVCYNYISSSSSSTPSPQCCNRVENVYETKAECLCAVLNEHGLNTTRVLGLPNACNLQIPSSSHCHSTPPAGSSPPPPPSGYSTNIRSSLMLYVLSAALCAGIFITI